VPDTLYFAYGSLLNRDRIRAVCPSARPVGTASIPHHALCFTGHSSVWEGGTATIGLAPARSLWGGLYRIDEAGRAEIEKVGAAGGYVWTFTAVEDADGDRVRAGVLVKVRDLEHTDASERYLEVLRSGWLQWGLDPDGMLQSELPSL
jgi:gamma-glutamylcyclotransferase (GGCT)/AIG2-like uncharacterized protein YtfP